MQWTEDSFIRFANNGITTSGYRVTQQISITSTTADKRSGNAAVSELTDEALKSGVMQAEGLAAISRPDPENMPSLPSAGIPASQQFRSFHRVRSRGRYDPACEGSNRQRLRQQTGRGGIHPALRQRSRRGNQGGTLRLSHLHGFKPVPHYAQRGRHQFGLGLAKFSLDQGPGRRIGSQGVRAKVSQRGEPEKAGSRQVYGDLRAGRRG